MRRALLLVAPVCVVALSCTSSSVSLTAPDAAKCHVSVENSMPTGAPAVGASGTLGIATARDCTWTVTSTASWAAFTGETTGQGSGTVEYRVAPNTEAAQRRAVFEINGTQLTVMQEAAPCRYSVSPDNVAVDEGGGTATLTVATSNGCAWTSESGAPWITIGGAPNGAGNGSVTLRVAANIGGQRTAAATVAGHPVQVSQAAFLTLPSPAPTPAPTPTPTPSPTPAPTPTPNPAPTPTPAPTPGPCTSTLSFTSTVVGSQGATGTVGVTAGPDCSWTASANASWLHIRAGAPGAGIGSVRFEADPNPVPTERSGTLTIAGQTVTVRQEAAPCSFVLSATSVSPAAAGMTGNIGVTVISGCSWTASANASWIHVTAGAAGSGNGTVTFGVDPNTGAARSASLTIAGQTVTVRQDAAPCSFALSTTSVSATAAGMTGNVAVTANSGCSWTASANASWLHITAGAAGSGNGTVGFGVDANPGAARSGSLTVAGQTVTVVQDAAPCSFALSTTSVSATAGGMTANLGVTANSGCAWTAIANAAWVHITAGAAGSGNGTVTIGVDPNTGAARSGTLTVAGQTVTVSQDAAPCSFALSATSVSAAAAGMTGSVSVTTNAGCAWTASAGVPWIHISAGASTTGSGATTFVVDANSGPERIGTLTIAGQTLTLTQAAAPPPPCTFTLAPTRQTVAASGATVSVALTASAPSCSWSATSGAPWITVTSSASGTGSGTVTLAIAANSGVDRSGTVSIAGQTFTVDQPAPPPPPPPCTFTLGRLSDTVDALGGNQTVTVTASQSSCTWTTVSNADWITVTSSASNTGSGTVAFTVGRNQSVARTGTLTIAGQTFTVTQLAGAD